MAKRSINRRVALKSVLSTAAGALGAGAASAAPDETIRKMFWESSGPLPTPDNPGSPPAPPGSVATPPPAAPELPTAPAATPRSALPTGRYRPRQPYLFQSVPARTIPRRLKIGDGYSWDRYGPTYLYADMHTGWAWDRPGGDWIDTSGARYGSNAWFGFQASAVSGSEKAASYTVDVVGAVQHAFSADRPLAFLLTSRGGPRTIAGLHTQGHPPPVIDVRYADGSSGKLVCRVVALNSKSSTGPGTAMDRYPLPAFIEFEPARKPVDSAALTLTVLEHWSGASTIEGFLLDPPVNATSVQQGLAASGGVLDAGLDKHPNIIGTHRYLDGRKLDDFVHTYDQIQLSEGQFDPAIYGNGPSDKTKLPHAGLGKWVGAYRDWRLVPSSYSGEGFKPLAPGLGALRIQMPAERGVADGATVGFGGSLASNGMIFLPEELFGRLDRIFVRFYFRLGSPYRVTSDSRFQVIQEGDRTDWITQGGKFGVAPDHSCETGGVSGSSGGGGGWQMRLLWADCDAGMQGPDEGGWSVGYHMFDFLSQNPEGHNYGREGDAPSMWGQRGGTGGLLYAGNWYCIETELQLNTVMTSGPGFKPDGALRAWVDGRLVYERQGMVFRSLPLVKSDYKANRIRPCRELGVRGLWLDWFHGGKTPASIDRTTFYTGLAWGKSYIGPMKL